MSMPPTPSMRVAVSYDRHFAQQCLDTVLSAVIWEDFEVDVVWSCYAEYLRISYMEHALVGTERLLSDQMLEELSYAYLANLVDVKTLRSAFNGLIVQYRPLHVQVLRDLQQRGYHLINTYGTWPKYPSGVPVMIFEGVDDHHVVGTARYDVLDFERTLGRDR